MTAIDCIQNLQIDFAAVHDSYWTHAGTCELMNDSLRRQFIALHSDTILEKLRATFILRYTNMLIFVRVCVYAHMTDLCASHAMHVCMRAHICLFL